MNFCAMLQTYQELENGNLPRFMRHISRYCDSVCIYDDGSTDGTRDYIFDVWDAWTKGKGQIEGSDDFKLSEVIYIDGGTNNFESELSHKQEQLDKCKAAGVDWVIRIDADETLDERAVSKIKDMCNESCARGIAFHTINLWRCPNFYRIDNSYNDVVFNRLWKLTPDLHFNIQKGLHLTNFPIGVTDDEDFSPYEIIHWGFASNQSIIDKYLMYKAYGQSGWALNRLIDESTLQLRKSEQCWFAEILPHNEFSEVFASPIELMVPNE